jgi:hypothetical protein
METLTSKSKFTISTLKSFAKRNADRLYVKETSSFDGMVDCVMPSEGAWRKTTVTQPKENAYYRLGIDGVYTVGGRDKVDLYEDKKYIGLRVYNCCGESILAVRK